MDRESVLRMAKEAGVIPVDNPRGMELIWWSISVEELERFAALVAAATREECARVCDGLQSDDCCIDVRHAAAAIRALK